VEGGRLSAVQPQREMRGVSEAREERRVVDSSGGLTERSTRSRGEHEEEHEKEREEHKECQGVEAL